jgi:(2Fe-2S) ferredoxin
MSDPPRDPTELWICVNRRYGGPRPSCAARGSHAIADAFERAFAERGLDIKVTRSPCQSACEAGPSVRLIPGPILFTGTMIEDVPAVVEKIAAHVAKVE